MAPGPCLDPAVLCLEATEAWGEVGHLYPAPARIPRGYQGHRQVVSHRNAQRWSGTLIEETQMGGTARWEAWFHDPKVQNIPPLPHLPKLGRTFLGKLAPAPWSLCYACLPRCPTLGLPPRLCLPLPWSSVSLPFLLGPALPVSPSHSLFLAT